MQKRKQMEKRKMEVLVGLFVLLGLAALLMLSLQVASRNYVAADDTYRLYARFDNIGGLKVRSPVKLGGVVIGRVTNIELSSEDWVPKVELSILSRYSGFTDSSSAAIQTAGLLGEQYIGFSPGFESEESEVLADGDEIFDTKSALVLEDLVGQFLYRQGEN